MRTIDIHAHLMPQCAWRAFDAGQEWHGFRYEAGQGLGSTVSAVRRDGIPTAKLRYTPEERIKDMDEQGVDVHVVSVATAWFGYHLEPAQGLQLAREVNDEIASMARQWPTRYAGLATLPVQDVKASIAELDRAVNVLGLKGAELDTVVNGLSWDEPQFLPLFKAAEEMGAILFFHPHPQDNIISASSNPYTLGNLFGVLVEDTLVYNVFPSQLWGYEGVADPASLDVSQDRFARYKKLVAITGIRAAISHSSFEGEHRSKITFKGPSCASVLSHDTWEKGYSYLVDSWETVVQDTDAPELHHRGHTSRRIVGDWYVYHWYEK